MSCRESAIQLLSRRDHSQWELIHKLRLKGFTETDIEQTLTYCHHLGYIDDVRYAQSQIRQHIGKGHGELRIRQELRHKHVSDNDVQLALDENETDWFELAKQAAHKKYRQFGNVDKKEYSRRVRFLQYRGFSFEQIQYALSDDV